MPLMSFLSLHYNFEQNLEFNKQNLSCCIKFLGLRDTSLMNKKAAFLGFKIYFWPYKAG